MTIAKKSDKSLFAALCLFFLVPFLYTCVRTNLIASFPDTDALSIAGHIEWFDLINETILAFLTVPLYSLLNNETDKPRFQNKLWTGFILSFALYTAFSAVIAIMAGRIAVTMNVAQEQLPAVTTYLCLETLAFIIGYAASYATVIFAVIGKPLYIIIITIAKAVITIINDMACIPILGANGIALSNIMVNAIIAAACYRLLVAQGLKPVFNFRDNMSWLKTWSRTGLFSGSQILLDNLIYAGIVCNMVNAVAEQGNYWVANNFIWGLLLIPTMALAEIIKRHRNHEENLKTYMLVNAGIILLWLVSMPAWRPFMTYAMGIENADTIMIILTKLTPFYIAYNISSVFSNIFISQGKTGRNFIVSVIVNIGYYGIVYSMFLNGAYQPGIDFICSMFGWGMVVNAVCTTGLYFLQNVKLPRVIPANTNN